MATKDIKSFDDRAIVQTLDASALISLLQAEIESYDEEPPTKAQLLDELSERLSMVAKIARQGEVAQ